MKKHLRKNDYWQMPVFQHDDKHFTKLRWRKISQMMKNGVFLVQFAKKYYLWHLEVTDYQGGDSSIFRKSVKSAKQHFYLRKNGNLQHIGYKSFMRKRFQQSPAPALFEMGHLRNFTRFLQGFQTQALEKCAKSLSKSNGLNLRML